MKTSDLMPVVRNIFAEWKSQAWFPYRTGNLKDNATSISKLNTTTIDIKIDGEVIAPYVQRLEENEKWHHKGWIKNRSVPFFVESLANKLGGEVK